MEMKRGKETPLKFTLSTIHIDRSSLVYSKGGHIARLPHLTLGRFASEIADDFESFEWIFLKISVKWKSVPATCRERFSDPRGQTTIYIAMWLYGQKYLAL